MIKQGITNYLKNLKYFFTPLGCIALGLILGLSILIPGVSTSITRFSNDIQVILSDTSIDFSALKDSIFSAVKALDWNDPISALNTMMSSNWMTDTLNSCVGSFVESTDAYTAQFKEIINVFLSDLVGYFIIVIVFLVFGFIGGYFLTRWLVRRNTVKRSLWKYFLTAIVDAFLSIALVICCIWLLLIWKPGVFLSSLFAILLFGFISLFEAYLINGVKKVKFRKIVNLKNILKLLITNIVIFIISSLLIMLVNTLTNDIAASLIGVVLIEIAFIVIGINAESYVRSVVESKEEKAS